MLITVLLRNAYLEDKQLSIENEKRWLSCIKSLRNVNFDTECKMLGPRLEKFFEENFSLNFNFNMIILSVANSHFTVLMEIQTY